MLERLRENALGADVWNTARLRARDFFKAAMLTWVIASFTGCRFTGSFRREAPVCWVLSQGLIVLGENPIRRI
jgi:hypothetical protein